VKYDPSKLLLVLDLMGTFVFGAEGSMTAAVNHLDVFGVMVLAFATALAGGIARDVLIGAVPPNAIRDWRYGATAFAGGIAVVFFHEFYQRVPPAVIIGFDAGGLSLFAMAGATKALDYHINPFAASLLGVLTGVGGGTVRDVMLAQVPAVLRADVYATAALAGAVLMILCNKLGLPRVPSAILGGLFCFTLRMIAASNHWNLPQVIPA
jgi:uncharacterized membrane protein YeiH